MSQEEFSPGTLGFLRVAVVVPDLQVANIRHNTQVISEALRQAASHGSRLVLFPELSLTSYSCGDLFYQRALQQQASQALLEIARAAGDANVAAVVGLPLEVGGRLYNCAAFVSEYAVQGIVPKTYLPSTNEYYEERWFSSTRDCPPGLNTVSIAGQAIPFGADLLFTARNLPGCTMGIEICEDLWAVEPPSGSMALAGATVLLNPSASDEILGKAEYRRALVQQQSARCLAAYLFAGAGPGESTTDIVFSGPAFICENGHMLAETERLHFETQIATADIDVQRLNHERLRNSSFSSARPRQTYRTIQIDLPTPNTSSESYKLLRSDLSPTPFVPANQAQRAKNCQEIFHLQAVGLARRLKHTGSTHVTLGLSGGLDSTLALLVTQQAFDLLSLPREGIVAITMPGFGTTSRTLNNSERLAASLGITLRQVPIREAVLQHFHDIGHDEHLHDITYENAQARERTQILMDIANQVNGFMVGTGDLSELALGWCTYNADHMSMYHVNSGVPKTLVRYLIEWSADSVYTGETAEVLRDISATPISPELLPLGENDVLVQETEATIGPYVLHDFFLFYAVRHAFSPRKIFWLACQVFEHHHTPAEILRWLRMFYRRFFASQFKRSAMPDGPKIGSVALSPRGDWRMPSDASSALWLQELDELEDAQR
ncbi:NAD(+) synthase [Tengunoibacter tsumagoiensis]|uniref:Glutamine-dependent NAD(+) synthetase n=1 Tax=Tengunoibacter tsumagoiensis TaxID=2014871 RepID=A0A402A5V5_9CHLR|nr:NAD(+) synthase [Tengunoibacter tsumagoiensis]GCE14492.1 NAD(+) synthase [Tengunoibacter tsumagoiensis]